MNKYRFIDNELEKRRSRHLFRELQTVKPLSGVEIEVDGHKMLNFCSNDYLGLSMHPMLQQRALEFMKIYGAGSTASRLVCGTFDCFGQVENRIADLTGNEGALILNSGFQANISLLPALADRETLILSDWFDHNSIIQGSILSRCPVERFRHNDLDHLKKLLKENRDKGISRILVVTESLFSMEGDQCDIDSIVKLSEEYDAFLIVDEAHATGILGERGMGLACGKNVGLTMGTFSKAGGSFGAYVACNKNIRDYLINFCYGFIYTTALPPPVIGSIDAALELIPTMDKERCDLLRKASLLRSSLHELDYDTGNSTTQIIPVIVGDEKDTLELSRWLEDNGILAMTFRPPSVGQGESRIRLALSVLHTHEHLEQLIDLLRKWRKRGGREY
ncbi:aminotransferase class I/II-fold pyridoxal phosphate-dependent enzyme [Thermodesulfobacteriota bacterium]